MASDKLYKITKSSTHGKGVFALRDIPRDTKIIEYIGEKITKKESERRSVAQQEKANHKTGAVYMFELSKRYDLDGNVKANKARRINHSCDPNCIAYTEDGGIWIYSIRRIQKDEELNYDYGFSIDHYDEHPCRCSSKKCLGYIVRRPERSKLKRRLKKVEKKAAKAQAKKR